MTKTASNYLRELADHLEDSDAQISVMVHGIDWRKVPDIPGVWGGGCSSNGPYATFKPDSNRTSRHETTFFPKRQAQ